MELVHSCLLKEKWVVRLPHDGDLLEVIEDFAREKKIKAGRVELIGAIKKAAVAFYEQEERVYKRMEFQEPMEILGCQGNISIKDDAPLVHLHIILGDKQGNTKGGHLLPGTVIFAGEGVIEKWEGPILNRIYDSQTGLPLWKK